MKKFNLKYCLVFILYNVLSSNSVYAEWIFDKDRIGNELEYRDLIYNPNIKTVNLYSDISKKAKIEPPVIDIRSQGRLILEFDELYEDARYFQAKIIHCNWDWSPSQLKSIEYLSSYNEFDIQDYEYSFNTLVPYTHYYFVLPRVILPGNYLIVIYNKDDPDELAFSKRFMVFDPLIHISYRAGESMGVMESRTHQQVDFQLNYANLQVYNPERDIKVVIRQNQSWITAIYNLRPTRVDEMSRTIEYSPFNLENNFYGGNEFRFFDLNSVRAPGRNVDRVFMKDDRIDAFLLRDKIRKNEFYSIWDDLNGGYIITNIDGNDPRLEAEYVHIHFFLISPDKINSDIYIFGRLSQYDLIPEFKMSFDPQLGGYTANVLLKQGWYDYIYYSPDDLYSIEGSHFETENDYEILVYLKPEGRAYDILAGYAIFNLNP